MVRTGGFRLGITMARAFGADTSGEWDGMHIEPVDPRSKNQAPVVLLYPYGIVVNQSGRRFFDEGIYTNAQMGPRHLRKYCVLTVECEKVMENAVTKLGFSARGYDRILKVARTIADLAGENDLNPKHLSEAVQYRTLDRNLWA